MNQLAQLLHSGGGAWLMGEKPIYWEGTLVIAKERGGMVVIWCTIMVKQLI